MKLETEHIERIREQIRQVETTEHLAELLQWIYDTKFTERKKRIKIAGKHLAYYAFKAKDRYITFDIPKKNGSKRTISAPRYKLKTIQKCLNELLNALFSPHKAATGFVPGKNVADNARRHIGKSFVYNIDLADFFPSVQFRRVKTVLELEPFSFPDKIAFLIANLCCDNGCLPQGAPTSPTLTNVVTQRLDRKLMKLANRSKANYSRYADDITFSSYKEVFDENFKSAVLKILDEENFKANPKKERLQGRRMRQEVTGIVVNEKSNVKRDYIKDIRYWLRTWKTFGAEKTQNDFARRYKTKKGALRYQGKVPPFQNYLFGKILYLGMVRGKEDGMFKKFLEYFRLLESDSVPSAEIEPKKDAELNQIFDTWKNEGIEAAIRKFFREK